MSSEMQETKKFPKAAQIVEWYSSIMVEWYKLIILEVFNKPGLKFSAG